MNKETSSEIKIFGTMCGGTENQKNSYIANVELCTKKHLFAEKYLKENDCHWILCSPVTDEVIAKGDWSNRIVDEKRNIFATESGYKILESYCDDSTMLLYFSKAEHTSNKIADVRMAGVIAMEKVVADNLSKKLGGSDHKSGEELLKKVENAGIRAREEAVIKNLHNDLKKD